MNIIACVKQVPDTEAQIKVKPDGSGIDEGGIKWVMNPYDEFGVEEALRMKEKNGGDVTIVTLGPQRAMETIRTALAMGADKGIHSCDPAFDGADAYTIGAALAAAIKGIPHDIIFCGQRAIDDDSAQVGSVLAELLGLPHPWHPRHPRFLSSVHLRQPNGRQCIYAGRPITSPHRTAHQIRWLIARA